MAHPVEITCWHWVGFISCVLLFLAADLGLFHRRAHVVKVREALLWSVVWFSLALIFAVAVHIFRSPREALEFGAGYLIELSLSLDNVFVIALIFGYFQIPPEHQHRVLFWGILGALLMRGVMIGLGLALVSHLHWVLYLFGAFLLYTGLKMVFVRPKVEPEKNPVIRFARKVYPISPKLDGQRFLTTWNGHRALTPLALVLIMVEATDLLFAVDSIPAVFGVTTVPFIVFTSNIFAILGLRSLYFVLAGAMTYFRFLKYGLAFVLVFIGVKMLIARHVEIPISVSLGTVAAILLISIGLSVITAPRNK
ncbi:MAG: hypothetical protein C5B50_29885 [Verrucomicrobia bacterium]|nr:MAG: hypothetical protein C5B50_29885 [Verrucomicrobiota bacterium]